jgi:hypothetical protein
MISLVTLACALSVPMSPRARLHVVARGAVPFGKIESQIHEVTEALARLTEKRSCTEENGCLVVDIHWQPAEECDCPTTVQMSLIMAPPAPVKRVRETILNQRVNAHCTKEAHDAIERVLRDK